MAEEKQKKYVFPIPIEQILFRKMAFWAVESKGSDIYFLNEVINLLRASMGEKYLKDLFGEKYGSIKKVILIYNRLTNVIKVYYDKVESGKAKEEDKKEVLEAEKKRPLIETSIYKVFFTYIKKSNLEFKTIPNQAFQVAKWGDKIIKGKYEQKPEGKK